MTGRQGSWKSGRQGGRESDREAEKVTGRQGGRESDREAGKVTGRQGAVRLGDWEAGRQGGWETGRLKGREAGKVTGRGHSHEMQGRKTANLLKSLNTMLSTNLGDVQSQARPRCAHSPAHHGPNLPCGCVALSMSGFVFNNWHDAIT